MKASEENFSAIPSIVMYTLVVQTFESVDEIIDWSITIIE